MESLNFCIGCWLKEFCILIDIQLPNFCQNNSRSFAKCGNRQWFSKTNKQPFIALRSGWTSFVLLIVPCETMQVWHYRLKVFKNRYGHFAWPNYEMFREYKMFLSCSALAHCFPFWILNTKYHQPLLFVVIAHEKSSGFQFTLDGTISSPKQSVALADDNHRQKCRQIYPCLVRQWKLSFCQFAFNVYQSKKTAANKIFFWYHSISVRALGEKLLFL